MKYILRTLYSLTLLLLLSACHDGNGEQSEGRAYQIDVRFEVDSTIVLDHLMLYADHHVRMQSDSLFLSPEHSISHEGHTAGIDELYLCSDHGELARFYAMGGMQVNLLLSSDSAGLRLKFEESVSDTVNTWLSQQRALFEAASASVRHSMIDSLCHLRPADVRNTLLLRDELEVLDDSIFTRRCLGALADEAKPDWLIKSIDQLLNATAPYLKRNGRIKNCSFQINDSTRFDLAQTRSDYLLICCWADYSRASMDSLQMLYDLLQEEYDMKRLRMLSCCLSAPDSAWWHEQTDKMEEGMHTLLPAGLSDRRIYDWPVDKMPTIILCDMYGNIQQRNVWGEMLRNALDRVPNKSGFAHTPKPKPQSHGRTNNNSRPSGH